MKQHKSFLYKAGEIYLFKNEYISIPYVFEYAIKQITDVDYSISNERIYKYIYYCNILKQDVCGWDSEINVAAGKNLLQEYLNEKNKN